MAIAGAFMFHKHILFDDVYVGKQPVAFEEYFIKFCLFGVLRRFTNPCFLDFILTST